MLKIFAHRGFVTNKSPENSIFALKEAIKLDFHGIEFDLWFLEDQFVIVHDQPSKDAINKLPKLKDFLDLQENKLFWLDFKNINLTNYKSAIKNLYQNLANKNLSNFYLIPHSVDYELMQRILEYLKSTFENEVQFGAFINEDSNIKEALKFIKENNIKFLSITQDLITKDLIKEVPDVEILAWTIKQKHEFENLKKLGIKFFASDIELLD